MEHFQLTLPGDGVKREKRNSYYIETLREQCMNFCDILTAMFQELPYLGKYAV